MGLIEAALALVGFVTVVVLLGLWFAGWLNTQIDPPADPDDPYVAGIGAAGRISAMAWELEQALYHRAREQRRDDR